LLILFDAGRIDSDPEVSSKIAKDYPSLQYGLDTIAEGKTTVSCVKAVAAAKGEGHIMTLLTNKDEELQQYKDKVSAEMNLVCAQRLSLCELKPC
jgi:hypothetical protein